MSLTFLLTALVIVATPGTGALFTLSAGLSRGPRASVLAAFACTLGIVPHLLAAITGLAALLRASGLAFEVVKYLGVAYLLYLAWTTWRHDGSLLLNRQRPRVSPWRVIRNGVAVNLLNPKLTIFFFAFLPQFVPASEPHSVLRMLGLSGVFMLMTFVVFVAYGVFAGLLRGQILTRPRLLRRIHRAFAVTFAGLAGKLAVTTR
ncbi:MAG: LysE family translocator [Actinomycetota bacterium]|nr:LysE family translocator [Actinomycetota bacterium]